VLSIVIPTLNAADSLERTIAAVSGKGADIVVADGGSTDGTAELAETLGARVASSAPGRGRQLNAGAEIARGDWLLFLHADTVLADGWFGAARRFMVSPEAKARAAAYTLRFDDDAPEARRIERLANWRARTLGLPYGDQGLLMARPLYDHLGGYRPLSLMEDVDMVRRIGRSFITILGVDAITSAERYRRDGWWARPLRNLLCLGLFHLGVPADRLREIYET
jgi:rSAM/selenodomain-associated transferase 2